MKRVKNLPTNRWFLLVAPCLLLLLASCAGQAPRVAESEAKPVQNQLCIPQLPTTVAARDVSSENWMLLGETDVVDSSGSTWEDGILVLGGSQDSYAIIGFELPFCDDVQLSLTGQSDGAWLGVGDYRKMCWDWSAGLVDAPQIVHLPVDYCFNGWASVYIVVYCPSGCEARLLLSVLGEWGMITPPAGLDDVTVPAELVQDYNSLEQYLYGGGDPWYIFENGSLRQQRAWGFYMFATYHNLIYDQLTICTVECDQETNDRLMSLVLRQCDGGQYISVNLGGRYFTTLHFNQTLTRGQLAWYGDWLRTHLYEVVTVVSPATGGNIPPP